MKKLSSVIAKIKQLNLFRISPARRSIGVGGDLEFRVLKHRRIVGLVSALTVAGLIVSLLFPNGRPISAAGFLTSTTDANSIAHLDNNAVNAAYYDDTTTDSDPTTQELLGVDPNWKNGVVRESYAINFNGSTHYVNVADSSSLSMTGNFTLEAWIKTNSVSTQQGIIEKYDTASTNNGYVLRLTSSGTVRAITYGASSNGTVTGSTTLTTGTWYHVAAVYDGAAIRVYVNGTQDGSTNTTVSPTDGTNALKIGADGSNANTFNGTIDEVRVSNIARYTANFTAPRRHVEDANTVGLWHMDEGTGITANDSSPLQNTGTLTNGPTWVTGARAIMAQGANNITLGSNSSTTNDKGYDLRGARSPGLSFDGTNDYVSVTDSASLKPSQITVALWVKTANTSAYLIYKYGAGSPFAGYALTSGVISACSSNQISWWVGGSAWTCSGKVLNDNLWHHVVGTYDGVNARIYFDGALVATQAQTGNLSGAIDLYMGSQNATNFLNGTLDDVRIYNRALTAAEITKLYNGNTDPDSSGLQGLWHLDEGAGTSAFDYSGNGNTGTLTNGPTWVEGQTTYPTDTPGLKFDGTDDYVSANPYTSSKVPLSWCAWAYPTSFATHKNILAQSGNDNWETFSLFIWQTSGQVAVQLGNSSINGNNLTLNQWVFLCGVTDGTTGRLYQDAVQTASGPDNRTGAASVGFAIGRSSIPGLGRYFAGPIDDVRIYNRALTAGEITDLYQQRGSDNISSGLVGKWNFNDGQGTTATDTSGQGNNGTLTNGPKWDSGVGTGNPSSGPGFSGNKNVTGQSWYTWRQKGGTFATVPIRTHNDSKQLGSEGVYASFANNANWSNQDYYSINSWAVEALSTTAPVRGDENGFPDQAYLIATAGGLRIINAKNNKVWMGFTGGGATGNLLKTASNVTVWAQNGAIWIGSASGLYKIDLNADSATLYTSSGNSTYSSTTGAIADRDDNLGYGAASGTALVATSVKDVHGMVKSNQSYIAVGTATGATVIQKETDASTARNYDSDATAGAQNNYASVQLTTNGDLYAITDTTGRVDRWDSVDADTSDQLTSSDRNWTTSTSPALNANPSGNPDALSVNAGASTASSGKDTVFVADANGFTKIDDHSTQASGTVTYYERTGTVGSSNWSSERYKGAIKFDGTDDYVSVGSPASLNLSSSAMSNFAWIKGNSFSGLKFIASQVSSGGVEGGWTFEVSRVITGKIGVVWNGTVLPQSNAVLNTNQWYHVGFTRSGSPGNWTVNYYINGVLDSTFNTALNPTAQQPTTIGSPGLFSSYFFNGLIDDVRIYNRALSASEVGDVYNGNPSSSGVVGLWHFDDATGTTARDASGNGNNGTLTNGPKFIFPAIAGAADKGVAVGSKATSAGNPPSNYAVAFNGNSQYVSVADSSSLQLATALTVSAWFKTSDSSSDRGIVRKDSSSGTRYLWGLALSGGCGETAGRISGQYYNGTCFKVQSSSAVNDNVWHHAALTISGTTLTLYVDGVSAGTTTISGTQGAPSGELDIGADPPFFVGGGRSGFLNGSIDEVQISNSVRYNANFTPAKRLAVDGQTAALWHFDEGSGTSAADSSANTNTGTLTGGPTWSTLTVADEAGPYFLGNTNWAWVGTNGASNDDGALTLVNLNTGAMVKSYTTTTHADLPDNDITSLSMTNSGLGIAGTEAGAFPANETGTFVDPGSQADTAQGDIRFKTGGVRIKSGGIRIR